MTNAELAAEAVLIGLQMDALRSLAARGDEPERLQEMLSELTAQVAAFEVKLPQVEAMLSPEARVEFGLEVYGWKRTLARLSGE